MRTFGLFVLVVYASAALLWLLLGRSAASRKDRSRNTPRQHQTLLSWLAMWGAIAGLPLTACVYYWRLLASGTLPVDSDSVGIPIGASVLVAMLMLPFASLLTALCTRRAAAGRSLFSWRRDKPLWSLAISLFFGVPAVLIIGELLWATIGSSTPAVELIWLPYDFCCAGWCILLRAAALSSRS